MSITLRLVLIVFSILFLGVVVWAVNRKYLQLRYTLVWIVLSFGMLVFAFFPGISIWMAGLIGIQTASNFIYLLALIALLILCFSLTVIVSKQSVQINALIQIVAIREFLKTAHDSAKEGDRH